MEYSKFDDLAKRIASAATRRGLFRRLAAGLGGAVASLPLLSGEAEAKKAKKAKKASRKAKKATKADKIKKALRAKKGGEATKLAAQGKKGQIEAQHCLPNGQVCLPANPNQPNRAGTNHRHRCGRCCSGYSVKAGQGRKCACVPTGAPADNRSQCCTGFLRGGRCAERRLT